MLGLPLMEGPWPHNAMGTLFVVNTAINGEGIYRRIENGKTVWYEPKNIHTLF